MKVSLLARLRARAHGDEGISLIELVVALGIVAFSLLALLTAFLTGATGIQSQGHRAKAVKVAQDQLDALRVADYAGVADGSQTVTVDGLSVTVTWDVTVKDAVTNSPTLTAGNPQFKDLVVEADWQLRGAAQSVTLYSAIRPSAGAATATPTPSGSTTAARSVSSVNLTQPITVDSSGSTTSPVGVQAVLTGYGPGDIVMIKWTNGAIAKAVALSSPDGVQWSGSIAAGEIIRPVPAGTTATMDLTLDGGFGVTRVATLTLQGPAASPLSVTPDVSTPAGTIYVEAPNGGGNCGGTNCDNVSAVTFRVSVSGFDTAAVGDSVKLSYTKRGGVSAEVALVRNTGNSGLWEYTFPAQSEEFLPGTARTFTYTARRASDNFSQSATRTLNVVEQ